MWSDVSDDTVDFDEAVEQFRKLTPISDDDYERLTARAKRKAFKVAGLANLDVVQDTFDAIGDAIKNGTSLDDFKAAVGDALEAAWHGDVENPGWRLETIFRTNVQRAYGEGRYRQATDPDTLEDRPYWQFDAVLDDATTEVCEDCNGTILPADDPWWDEHQPPLHFNCRSTIITLTEDQAAAQGGAVAKPPKTEADDGFGDPPLDDTDDDQEQADFEPDLSDYDPGLAKQFEEKQEEAPPAPEPKRAEEGVHYKAIARSDLTAAEDATADSAMAALAEHDLLDELAATPLNRIRMVSKIDDPGISPNMRERVQGFYRPGRQDIVLRVKEPNFGHESAPFKPGKSFTVSQAAENWDEAVKRNMLHEVGHHLHDSGPPRTDELIRRAYDSSSGQRITKYADTNHSEYWAETFTAFKIYPDELKAHDPTGFQMVKDVLALRNQKR